MSVAATNWVWTQSKAEGADRLVLLALADFADETGKCFGSWGTMQRKTLLSRRTIARSLSRLVESGDLAEIEHARTVNGRNMATVWQLPVGRCHDDTGVILTLPRCHSDITPGVTMSPPRCHDGTPTIVNVKETEKNVKGATAPAPATTSPSHPSSSAVEEPPQQPSPKKAKAAKEDLSALELPHGAGFRKWWTHFTEHRATPIKGRVNPLTVRAAEIILGQLAAVNEQQAVEAIKDCIASGWVKPYPPKPAGNTINIAPTVVRQGPVQPSEAERRMLEMEARMKGAA